MSWGTGAGILPASLAAHQAGRGIELELLDIVRLAVNGGGLLVVERQQPGFVRLWQVAARIPDLDVAIGNRQILTGHRVVGDRLVAPPRLSPVVGTGGDGVEIARPVRLLIDLLDVMTVAVDGPFPQLDRVAAIAVRRRLKSMVVRHRRRCQLARGCRSRIRLGPCLGLGSKLHRNLGNNRIAFLRRARALWGLRCGILADDPLFGSHRGWRTWVRELDQVPSMNTPSGTTLRRYAALKCSTKRVCFGSSRAPENL